MTKLEALSARLHPRPEGKILLGLSGGADSLGLLRMLLLLREAGGLDITALHVNHGLRGSESDADEAFVRHLCGELQVPLRVIRLDLQGRRDENAAREARYAAFHEVMAEEGISTLVLAHQRDDQTETFLMRLLRGAGPEGLSGMRPREAREGYVLLRPMLEISGKELRDALREAEQPWREDSSNQEDIYLRNRIRRELIPRMEELAPGAAGRIANAAGLIGIENDAMDAAAEKLLRESERLGGLSADALEKSPEAIRTRALRHWWKENGPELAERELSYAQTRRLAGLLTAERGTIINLPAGWRARREKETIRLLPPGDKTKNNRPKKRGEGAT